MKKKTRQKMIVVLTIFVIVIMIVGLIPTIL